MTWQGSMRSSLCSQCWLQDRSSSFYWTLQFLLLNAAIPIAECFSWFYWKIRFLFLKNTIHITESYDSYYWTVVFLLLYPPVPITVGSWKDCNQGQTGLFFYIQNNSSEKPYKSLNVITTRQNYISFFWVCIGSTCRGNIQRRCYLNIYQFKHLHINSSWYSIMKILHASCSCTLFNRCHMYNCIGFIQSTNC